MYHAKRKLKGSKIAITEHLTRRRYKLFQLAKEAFGVRNVWTLGGKISTNKEVDAEGKRYLIKYKSDIFLPRHGNYATFLCFSSFQTLDYSISKNFQANPWDLF